MLRLFYEVLLSACSVRTAVLMCNLRYVLILYMTRTHPFCMQNIPTPLTGKSLNSLGALSAWQASAFKRRRLGGSEETREEFMLNPKLSSREKRALSRGWDKRGRKLRMDFDKSGSYLSHRIYEMTTHIDNTAQHIQRLDAALAKQDVDSLLARSSTPLIEGGEGAGDSRASGEDEGGGQKPEISDAQANRLWYQAYTSMAVLREELVRDTKQPEFTKAAKAVSDKSLLTDAAVKAADAKRFDLMSQA